MQLGDYELLELNFESGIQVSKVRHQATGRNFQIHVFHGESLAEFDRVCAQLARLPKDLTRLVETSRSEAAGSLRTELLPEGTGIVQWADSLAGEAPDTDASRIYRLAVELKSRRTAPPRP